MLCKTRTARTMMLACTVVLAGCVHQPEVPRMEGMVATPEGSAAVTVPFTLDDNRMFVEVRFARPDGTTRTAMAFVNMGSVGPVLSPALYRELGIGDGHALDMRIGSQTIRIDPRAVQTTGQAFTMTISLPFTGGDPRKPELPSTNRQDFMAQMSGPLHVEAILPSGVLQNFDTVFDYGARTLTLAPPGTLPHDGIAVPFRRNPSTGFVTVDAAFAGARHALAIDNGGSYSVLRSDAIERIAKAHPAWMASGTAIGEANNTGSAADLGAPVLKLRDATIDGVQIPNTGVVGSGMGSMLLRTVQGYFWDFYSGKAGEPVDGWIGGNVLKDFRITFDYVHRVSYWQRQREPDAHELDTVGITLLRDKDGYAIDAIATKDGRPSVDGAAVDDRLLRIGDLDPLTATRGQIFAALHGAPGERRTLLLERDGKRFIVNAVVTAF